MDVRRLYDKLHRDPQDFPLFDRIWQVITFAPSSQQMDEEGLVSLAADAFDYLQATGAWKHESTTGDTEMFYDGKVLRVTERDDEDFRFERAFVIN